MAAPSPLRTLALTVTALCGFAANSLLCRGALGAGTIDAGSFTAIRLLAGALMLSLLAGGRRREGSWGSAAALCAYAIAFSLAYVRIGAAVGALVLFGVVQVSMVAWSLRAGERPSPNQWLGLAVALGGLLALTLPRLHAPDPVGVGLMAAAGVAWGVYTLRGRGARFPLAANADNFLRSVPFAAALLLIDLPRAHLGGRGVALAVASGALDSGLGYSVWYAALPGLTGLRAAIVQLTVPVIAAAGAVVLLGESLSGLLVGAGSAILGGVALALWPRRRTRP